MASATVDRYGRVTDIIRDECDVDVHEIFTLTEGSGPLPMAFTTAACLTQLTTSFALLRPDVVVTIADRHETIATAIAASYSGIPLAHVQGGEVTGSIDERVRHSVTKLADLHVVATERARSNVLRLGEDPEFVHVTGCPSIDLAAAAKSRGALDFDPFERFGGVGAPMNLENGYLVVLHHPVTTEYANSRRDVEEVFAAVRDSRLPVLWFWPNVDAGGDATSKALRALRERGLATDVHFFKNLPPLEFLVLVNNARALVGNSSVGIRECSFLGVPVVNIGTRQEGRERAPNVVQAEPTRISVSEALTTALSGPRPAGETLYGDGAAGSRIARLLAETRFTSTKSLHTSR